MATASRPTLSWMRVLGEFVVIVLGVLVALWVNGWAEERQDRVAEQDFLERLLEDLRQDTASFSFQLTGMHEKREALQLVGAALRDGLAPGDTLSFQIALEGSQGYGWSQLPLNSAAFDELISIGGLNLIKSSTVRQAVLSYHTNAGHRRNRAATRTTDYPALIYRTVSPQLLGAFRTTSVGAPRGLAREDEETLVLTVEPALVAEALQSLRVGSNLQELNAERHYAVFLERMVADNLDEAISLIPILEAAITTR